MSTPRNAVKSNIYMNIFINVAGFTALVLSFFTEINTRVVIILVISLIFLIKGSVDAKLSKLEKIAKDEADKKR